jgi:hypothetical protein
MRVENQTGQPAAHDLVDGAGVTVAWLADGVDRGSPDFQRAGSSIFTDYADFSGEGANAPTDGAEAFGDTSSIAAQGSVKYDLAGFVNPAHPLPAGCTVRVRGVAPGASLVGLKVFGATTVPFTSFFLQAIDRAVTMDHVDVINESFGANVYPDRADDPIALADTAATQAGVTVVASSGDAGTGSTEASPADAPGVIAVGATTQLRSYLQTTSYGTQLSSGGWISDNVSALSSGGFTQFGPHTVDVVAPGDLGWAVCGADAARFSGCLDDAGRASAIQLFGGTSESSGLVAGAAALVIQAYERAHRGARPSPRLVKQIIVSSATDLHVPAEEQGAGLVNAFKAVQTAMSVHDGSGSPARQGRALLASRARLSTTAPAGTSRTFSIDVTNTGAEAQTVSPAPQALEPGPFSFDGGSLSLAPSTDAQFDDGAGVPSAFVTHTFQVLDGTDRLDASLTWDAAGQPGSRARETLFDPSGRVAAYTLPQGPGGFGHVAVHDPAAGLWTAVVWTRRNATVYTGAVQLAFETRRFRPLGTVSPASRVLASGASGSFDLTIPLPAQAGDLGVRLVLGTGHDDDGSIPVTVRALVPVDADGGTFRGVLTGGNGRPIFGGQTLAFQLDVPAGKPALDLALTLRDPDYNLTGLLVDPSGEPVDVQSTAPIGPGGTVAFTDAMQLFHRAPRAGRWAVVLVLNPPVGRPATATVAVTNTGVSRKAYFLDPRLRRRGALALLGLTPTTVLLPMQGGQPPPVFLVPPDTGQLAAVAIATDRVQIDVAPTFGSPDLEGVSFADASVAVVSAPEVAPGLWFAAPTPVGPFPASGAPPEAAAVAAAVETNLFDTSVTPDTGDLWLSSIVASAPYRPLVLEPGQSGTMTVTITPAAPRGTVVSGFLEIDTFAPSTASGDEVATIPYTYRVG